MWPLYDNTGIELRYNCQPVEWYLKPHSWEERTAIFQKHALDLLADVTLKATASAGVELDAIDILVTNTITGLAIPSLDAKLFNRLKLKPTVERLPIFGLGCGGGVAGLARATRLAHATEGAHVLFLTVDLCSLCLRVNDPSPAMFVSTALFGDGAAGVLLRNTADGSSGGPRILAVGEWCWPDTEHIMGWDIKDDGFGVVLSPELPSLMRKALAPALHDFLDRNGFRLSDFNGFLFHPGGRKLIETMQEVLGLEREQLRTFVGGVARLRQHVVGDRLVRARPGAEGRRPRPASLGGVRAGLFRLFRRGRPVMVFGTGAILLAYLTVQRLAELWWAKANEARLMASGGIEYGHSHLPLMILFHAAWLAGLWLLAYDRRSSRSFSRCSSFCRWPDFGCCRRSAAAGPSALSSSPANGLSRGPYRFLRHPNYAVVTREIAVVPLFLDLRRRRGSSCLPHRAARGRAVVGESRMRRGSWQPAASNSAIRTCR